jgi:uncharacterized protein (TIGR03437 family)
MLLPFVCAYGATFGTLIPVKGTVSDLALDERRNQIFVANFSGYRIEVLNAADGSFVSAIPVSKPPSTVALSPDSRFLIVGQFDTFQNATAPGALTIFDLDAGGNREITVPHPVLAAFFGGGSKVFVVTTIAAFLVDPFTAAVEPLTVHSLTRETLPVALATFPQKIVNASIASSADGKAIVTYAYTGTNYFLLQYRIGEPVVYYTSITTTNPGGPASVSVNADGTRLIAGTLLLDSESHNLGEFPNSAGDARIGGHAYDSLRGAIYSHVPATTAEAPVLHILDPDNLAVRERIQLRQMLAGRTLFSSNFDSLYAVSDNGVLILPVGRLATAARVAAVQPDLVFQGDACNRRIITQFLDIVNPGGGATDFSLSLPANAAGVRLSALSGTTPARIRVDVDPTAFQNEKGTVTVPVTISSAGAINLPTPVRLLINTRDVNQRGRIINVPGKIVDILSDTRRNRFYLVRQDTNQVLMYDSVAFRLLGAFKTGNTPLRMAITEDSRYLLVTNDNSHYVSVFDLDTLTPAEPLWTPNLYLRTLAVARGAIWATARGPAAKGLLRIDFPNRIVTAPPSLGIYKNEIPATATLAVTPSMENVLLALPDGTMALWEAAAGGWPERWVVSRKDVPGLSGGFAALSDRSFVIGPNVFDESLFPVASLAAANSPLTTSGIALLGEQGIRISAGSQGAPGLLERIDLTNRRTYNGTLIVEAPVTATSLATQAVGQRGQSILPFTRTLAIAPDGNSILFLSQAGITAVAPNFDAPSVSPVITSVVNSADRGPAVASGGLISISGLGLAPGSATADVLPLPSTLNDVCITVSNVALPLFSVSSTQVAAQLPFTVSGTAPMVVRTPGGISAPFNVNIAAGAPAIFRNGTAGREGGLPAVFRQLNGEILNFTNPIHPNEGLTIYLTGLGRTSPDAPLGNLAPANPYALVTLTPDVTVGDVKLRIDFAGLVPGLIGVYQIDATVPGSAKDATQVLLTVKQGTNSTSVPIRVAAP